MRVRDLDESDRLALIREIEKTQEVELGQSAYEFSRAEVLLFKLRFEEAKRVLLGILSTGEADVRGLAYLHLSRVHQEMDELREAIEVLQKAEMFPNVASAALVEQAGIFFGSGRMDAAVDLLRRATEKVQRTDAVVAGEIVSLHRLLIEHGVTTASEFSPLTELCGRFPAWEEYLRSVP